MVNRGGISTSTLPDVEIAANSSLPDPITPSSLQPTPTPEGMPGNWTPNELHHLDEKATKSDNASIPIHLWNNALASALGKSKLTVPQECALDKIRTFVVERIWRKSVTMCFCLYLRCKQCHLARITKLFESNTEHTDCAKCRRYMRTRLKSKLVTAVHEGESNSVVYKWTRGGKAAYKKLYCIIRQYFKPEARKEINKDIAAAKDCLERVCAASTWKWDAGSRLFFWRWGEFTLEARDGATTFVNGTLPKCEERQNIPKDPKTLELVKGKLADVRRKGYIAKENAKVLSVTSFFDVPKGKDDICMVYNATSSGLNHAVWAPWFSLPTVETHLQAVDPGTFMGDCDIGEMFLNFMLDVEVRPFAGVDLTCLFPQKVKGREVKVWENWTRMLMGYKPSPYITTWCMCRVLPFLIGRKDDPSNVFRWDRVVLNLPGSASYTPTKPRVYRVRRDGKTMAADLFIYIDDVRNTAPSEEECWAGAHQVCCRLTWLGIQDAARKKNFASQTPRAWAGSIVHSDADMVTVLVSEEKWKKTKDWLKWVLTHEGDEQGLAHKELEKCRGFLIYVSRTYLAMKPYLRGLHKTIDSWRPCRDEDGWKILYEIVMAKEKGEWIDLNNQEPDEYVKPVQRLRSNFLALEKLTSFAAPPKVIRRKKSVGNAYYGFGDASGMGFGFALEINGVTYAEFGQWSSGVEDMHSNYKELRNLVQAVSLAHEKGALDDCKLYIFTDNLVAKMAYYNGGSNVNKELDELVFKLWILQMQGNFALFIYHVAGTRMIESGVDGLSRGDKSEGILLGMQVGVFVPIHQDPIT